MKWFFFSSPRISVILSAHRSLFPLPCFCPQRRQQTLNRDERLLRPCQSQPSPRCRSRLSHLQGERGKVCKLIGRTAPMQGQSHSTLHCRNFSLLYPSSPPLLAVQSTFCPVPSTTVLKSSLFSLFSLHVCILFSQRRLVCKRQEAIFMTRTMETGGGGEKETKVCLTSTPCLTTCGMDYLRRIV